MPEERKKRKLTQQQEFGIMKLVLDKFLWLGFGIMLFGLSELYSKTDLSNGIYLMLAGAVILVVFIAILVREYEISK